jgi:polysaccharide deacetylase family protein (PEP-CTERM system associated)
MNQTILLTFDIEDWFQVENFKKCIPVSSWPSCELRVENNVHKILDLLDSMNTPHTSRLAPNGSIKATFFVLGWIAERLPNLVREIQERGHEIASHGYDHILCKEQPAEDLKNDLMRSKKLLEDITGTQIYGYRAPSFSINHNILKIVEDSGYLYDSSFNSFKLNRRYGQLQFGTNNDSKGISIQISDTFYELPITNLKIGKQVIPWGGGGYFRLVPVDLFNYGVRTILSRHGAYVFYIHPWEIDPEQPRVNKIPMFHRFRHYANLGRTFEKCCSFVKTFEKCSFQTCYEYLKSHGSSSA